MSKRLTTDEFINKARQIHGGKYDYFLVEYVNNRIKVNIICPVHGSFSQSPNGHLNGNGCPMCAGTRKMDGKEFIKKAQYVHGIKYDYSRVKYVNNRIKVKIVCPVHGVFEQVPNAHLNGQGCPECAKLKRIEKKRLNLKDFIKKSYDVHGGKYDYSKAIYVSSRKKVEIICPQHGSFFQNPNDHLQGKGCPKCVHRVSKGEQELADTLKAKGLQVIQSYRKWHPERPGLEIDIYLPEHQVGIEYNGEYWHRDRERDEEKIRLALGQGIRIITVWESEWKKDRDVVLERVMGEMKKGPKPLS